MTSSTVFSYLSLERNGSTRHGYHSNYNFHASSDVRCIVLMTSQSYLIRGLKYTGGVEGRENANTIRKNKKELETHRDGAFIYDRALRNYLENLQQKA